MPTPTYTYEFMLGQYGEGFDENDMVNVEDAADRFGLPPFPWTWSWGTDRYTAGDGIEYSDGAAQITWRFVWLSPAAWTNLMAFFPNNGLSNLVYIRTKRDDDLYKTMVAMIQRPEIGKDANRGVGGFFDVTIRFTAITGAW